MAHMPGRALPDLEELASLNVAALKALWRAVFKSEPPPAAHKEFFIRLLAYALQIRAEGDLRKSSLEMLRESEKLECSADEAVAPPETRLHPGTRLLRQWGGSTHEVLVVERGYAYRGRSYTSLSEIARSITGARWSGPRFFGLRSPSKRSDRTA
jgi:hypothetical protein